MAVEQTTVLEYIERMTGKPEQILTVERTSKSKYLFYLLIRAVGKRLRPSPRFFLYEKQKGYAEGVKGLIEEHSLFGNEHFYVLEGFSQAFVDGLNPPPGTYIVAETDGGTLKVENYNLKKRRDILKVLLLLMNMDLSLRELIKLDWSFAREYEEYEPILTKAKLMRWDVDRIAEELKEFEQGNILTLIKRSDFKPVFDMMRRNGATWMHNRIIQHLGELIHYRSLRLMGFEEERAAKEIDVGYRRRAELEDAMKMLTGDDIKKMVERVVNLDYLLMGQKELGLQLLLLNAPIRIKK